MLNLDTPTPEPDPKDDIGQLRLPQNFGHTLGVLKVLINVPVGKPRPEQFFRTHKSQEMVFPGLLYEDQTNRESYLVMPRYAEFFGRLARPTDLYLAVDTRATPLLIPVSRPGEDGRLNPWHESRGQAVLKSRDFWVRIAANQAAGVYDVFVAAGHLPEPQWPEESLDELIRIAFRGKIVDNPDHPVIQGLQGRQ
jgi:hypothetical protein